MRNAILLILCTAGLAFLSACDNATSDAGNPDGVLHAPGTTAFVNGAASFSSTLHVLDPGYTPYGGSISPLETAMSGTVNATGPGYASVSLSLERFSTDPVLAAMHPSTITSSPDALHFSVDGQSRTLQLELFMQDVLLSLTEDAGPGSGRQSGQTPFRELSKAQRLQRLQQDGFEVESLGQGRYTLTRTESLPGGSTYKTTMTYDSRSGAISETKLYMDEVLVSESSIANGVRTAPVRQGSTGRIYDVEMPLPLQ